jgi:tRNA(fMet)-specific endonuclease VapC
MVYALDTNTLIYFFKGVGRVAEHLLAHPPSGVAIPIIVAQEIETRLAKSKQPRPRRMQFDQLLNAVTMLSFDRDAAHAAANLRAQLKKTWYAHWATGYANHRHRTGPTRNPGHT